MEAKKQVADIPPGDGVKVLLPQGTYSVRIEGYCSYLDLQRKARILSFNQWFESLDDIWFRIQRTTRSWTPNKIKHLCKII